MHTKILLFQVQPLNIEEEAPVPVSYSSSVTLSLTSAFRFIDFFHPKVKPSNNS